MRIVKLFLISAIVLFATTTFVFILFPSHIRISRVININSSREKIAAAISDLKTWEQWNHFISRSELTHKSISSPSFGKNAFLVSDQFKVAIIQSMPDTVKTYWEHGNRGGFEGVFHLVPNHPGNTTVQWYFDFSFKWYPWEKLGSMFYDKQIGPVMEESLLNLKRLVENNQ
jgi:Polyketide cyclase / dehydrase and lipid transport